VTLIAAHLDIDVPGALRVVHVGSTLELETAASEAAANADVIIMAAAVADYRPESVSDAKIAKEKQGDVLELRLVKNPDILAGLAANRRPGQVIVGFAAETEPDDAALLKLGAAKIARKGADLLVVNRVGWNVGFATESNTVIVLDRAGTIVGEASGTKRSVADRILDLLPQSN
jgi:phosphopantothenoylcysteine decarboxylase/phosphopantothenate--cysteine ligase